MSPLMVLFLLFLHSSTSMVSSSSSSSHDNNNNNNNLLPIKASYWPAFFSSYSPPSALNASLFTHLLYAFAPFNETSSSVQSDDIFMSNFSSAMRARNPSITTLLSIGGANSIFFSTLMASPAARQSLISSSIALARQNGFDGLDLDWEFPNSDQDMANLALFVAEWRAAAETEATNSSSPRLLLTAAVYYSSKAPNVDYTSVVPYPVSSIAQKLDWLNIMSYDYAGGWANFTGEPTALSSINSNVTTEHGLQEWKNDGLPESKGVVGLTSFGRSWQLASSNDTGIGAKAISPGPAQNVSQQAGVMYYFEIEEFIKKQNAAVVHDETSKSVYCYAGDVWVGYDDEITIATKASTFMEMGWRGYFFWTVSFDTPMKFSLATQAFLAWDTALSTSLSPTPAPSHASHNSLQGVPITTSLIILTAWMLLFFI